MADNNDNNNGQKAKRRAGTNTSEQTPETYNYNGAVCSAKFGMMQQASTAADRCGRRKGCQLIKRGVQSGLIMLGELSLIIIVASPDRIIKAKLPLCRACESCRAHAKLPGAERCCVPPFVTVLVVRRCRRMHQTKPERSRSAPTTHDATV